MQVQNKRGKKKVKNEKIRKRGKKKGGKNFSNIPVPTYFMNYSRF